MSYSGKTEYEIVPGESFSVIRRCAGCGRKTHFKNTARFRVNANGSRLDVWLIYQCEKCKHTFNLTVYERKKASAIPRGEYRRFLGNDEQLAKMYGTDIHLFRRNRAEIDFENLEYDLVRLCETEERGGEGEQIQLTIHNPCELKLRPEKQIAGVLELSGSQVKKLMEQGGIKLEESSPRRISVSVSAGLFPGKRSL